jgi:hypothetical protein
MTNGVLAFSAFLLAGHFDAAWVLLPLLGLQCTVLLALRKRQKQPSS